MESKRPIVIGAVFFGLSTLMIGGYTSLRMREFTREFGEQVEVVTALNDIPEYSLIRPEMLKTTLVFKSFKQPQTVSDLNDLVGKAPYVPVYKGEQITLTKLVHPDGKPVLDRQIEKSMRAITVQIAPHTGVGRLIRPGNRIDVLTTVNFDRGGSTIFETKALVQNVLVLATGKAIRNEVPPRVNRDVLNALETEFESRRRKDMFSQSLEPLNTSRPDDNYTYMTLQLKTEDAEKILFVSHSFGDGRLYYTLRNSADVQLASAETTLLDDVLGPQSDFGKSKVRRPVISPAEPKWNDSVGGQPVPVY